MAKTRYEGLSEEAKNVYDGIEERLEQIECDYRKGALCFEEYIRLRSLLIMKRENILTQTRYKKCNKS